MSVDATRVERVDVDVSVPVRVWPEDRIYVAHKLTFKEKDARDLMHALAGALGYDAVPK